MSSAPTDSGNAPDAAPDAGTLDAAMALDAAAPAPDASIPDAATEPDAAVPDAAAPMEPLLPARYSANTLRSPITPYVAQTLQAIAARNPGATADVFMKVGASGTVSRRLLYCFAGDSQPQYRLNLDGRDHLLPTIDFFRGGDAAGTTPFDRDTIAAEVGRSAVWAISGDPSPLEQEMAAIHPRFAFVNYGTNDMGLGSTYQSALWPFVENLTALLDQLLNAGIVPIVSGLNPRSDSAGAARWVPTYDAVTRGIAEARQVPYISLYLASRDLPSMGLLSDGIHGNSYSESGESQPCVFTSEALAYNYNIRNLLSIEVLHDVRQVVVDGLPAPHMDEDLLQGDGSTTDPFVIDRLPFTHAADTSASPHRAIGAYPACDNGQDESGPEYHYVLNVPATTRVRAMVFDGANVDVDLHLLGADGSAGSCVERNDRIIQGPLAGGSHVYTVDTYVSGGVPRPGAYLFVVVECDPGDSACD